jgi:hypothetical protein
VILPDLKTPLLWVFGLGLVAALATAGIERTRAAGARADLASEKAYRSKENTARAMAALADLQRVVALMASHSKIQQENVNAFETRLKVLTDRGRTVAAERDRLRKQYDDFAARDRDKAATDLTARKRVADRSAVLAAMAARSRELLEGGRLVVEGRDNEVQLLLDTVSNDRALFAPPSVQPPQRPPLPREGRRPPITSICSPTCSAGLRRERENWRASLVNAAPPALSASDTSTPPGLKR